ncbi:MAG: hypothetical protein WA159_20215 [Variovorax sp.]
MQLVHVDSRWMTEARWFASDDVDLVRAGVLLLEAAARSTRPGCLSGDPHILARLAGVSADFWALRASQVLEGFELVEDGSWRHVAMADLAAAVRERFGAQLEELAASSVLASQAVDEFPLIGEPKTAGRSKGKRALPKDYCFPDAVLKRAVEAGFVTEEHQSWLLTKFRDFANAQKRLYSDWDATARNFISSAITGKDFHAAFGYYPRESRDRLAHGSQGQMVARRTGPETFESAALSGSQSNAMKVMAARYGAPKDDGGAKRPTFGFGFGFAQPAGGAQ